MNSALKYGSLANILEIYASLDEFGIKPNASIITYLLTALYQNSLVSSLILKIL